MGARSGSSTGRLLLLAAAAAVLLLVLKLALGGPDPAATDPGADPGAGEAPAAESGDLARETEPATALDAPGAGTARAGAPLGVRLAGPARLRGRVVDRASGAGVGGARVELLSVPPAGATLLARVLHFLGLGPDMLERIQPVAAVMSGADGGFAFEGVRAGSWYLEARGPYSAPEGAVRARVLATGAGGPLDVFVRAGGRVLGRVLAPDGEPAPGAKVVLAGGPGRFLEDAASGDLRIFETETDAQGAFVFEGVPPGGGYNLSASGARFAISHRLGIDVAAGRDSEADVQARVGGTIVGRVLDATAADSAVPAGPLAGAHVAAVPRGLRDLLLAAEVLAATHCTTGSDGSFTMRYVPPGEVDLVAVAPDHLPAVGAHLFVADASQVSAGDLPLSRGTLVRGKTVDGAGVGVAGVQVRWNPLQGYDLPGGMLTVAPFLVRAIPGFVFPKSGADGSFEAGPLSGGAPWRLEFSKLGFEDNQEDVDAEEAAAGITVVMRRGGSVEGVVMDAARSEPVTTFTVSGTARIDSEAGAPSKWNPFSGGLTFEDPLGRFRLESIAAGRANLVFSSPGYADEGVLVEIVEAQTTKGLIVKLRPGGTVRGTVTDEDARPVSGAHVVAVTEEEAAGDGPMRPSRQPRAQGRNEFEFDATKVPPPLMGYAASLGLLGDKAVVTDARGAFEVRGVAAGSVTVRAFHRDHAWGASAPLAMEEGGLVSGVEIVLEDGGAVEGRVTDRHGLPVPGDLVLAMSPTAMGGMGGPGGRRGSGAQGALYEGQSDEQGFYRIDHMAAGGYFLVVTRGDEALNPMSFMGNLNFDLVTVPENETVRYDLVDRSAGGCRVRGIVTDQGKPVPGGNLLAMNFESGNLLGIDFKVAHVGEDGKFEFPGLAPGDYQLQIEDAVARAKVWLEVPDQAEIFVTVAIPDGGIEGTVVDEASGEPVEGAWLTLRAQDEPEVEGMLAGLMSRESRGESRMSDKDGRFEYARLREADYELAVRPPRGEKSRARWAPCDPRVVRVREGRVERGIEIRLPAALSLAGVVKDAEGAPVKGALVLASLQDREDAPFERDRTDDDGRFEILGLSPGVYTATATAKDHADGIARDLKVERGAAKAPEVEIRLPKGVLVSVRVYGSDGRPASGARAQLSREGGDRRVQAADAGRVMSSLFTGEGASDSEGRIELGRFVPGEYRLEAQRGLSKATLPKVKVPGDREQVELRVDLP